MKYLSLLLVLLSVPATIFAQNVVSHLEEGHALAGKALGFAQIAFGGTYETVLNVTNRGTAAYKGTLVLRASDPSKPFPARVNGTPAPMNLTLDPGATATFRITSGDPSSGTLSGFATITPTDLESRSLLEGNLTYYIKSPDGSTIADSVGVAPSRPILQTVIPFDDFRSVALALANPGNEKATITLTLFDDRNVKIGTASRELARNQHMADFLFRLFPNASPTRGRVDLHADRQFLATALTYVSSGQASSLPIQPSVKLYEIPISVGGETSKGDVYLAFDGLSVTGYYSDEEDGGSTITSGTLEDGNLGLFVIGCCPGDSDQVIIFIQILNFDPLKSTQNGTLIIYFPNQPTSTGMRGTATMTALN
jgi:hypothetical protein